MNNHKIRNLVITIIICVVLSLSLALLALINVRKTSLSFHDEQVLTIEIESEEDIMNCLSGAYNDNLILKNDIVITHSYSISRKDTPFSGTFKGNGYTIKINNTVSSLFEYVAESGVIEDVTIEYTGSALDNEHGIITKENLGTIRDINIKCNNMRIVSSRTVGGVAAINRGKIENIVCEYTFTNALYANVKNIPTIGGICANNYGTISNVIVYPTTNTFDFTVSSSGKGNAYIGAVYVKENAASKVNNCYAVLDVNLVNLYDITKSGSKIIVKADITSDMLSSNDEYILIDSLPIFKTSIWEIDQNKIIMKNGDLR